MIDLGLQVAAGAAVAMLLASVARRAGALSRGGALAAFLVGWSACVAGLPWAVLLLVFFVSGTGLSRLPARNARAVESIVEKGGERDAVQVLANGGVFAACALCSVIWPDARWALAGTGALAAACADTWATELGTRYGGTPRQVLTMRAVPAGTSGAVSGVGVVASVMGAVVLAGSAALLVTAPLVPLLLAGFGGSMVDTLLGATVQSRRWCDACSAATERIVHDCGVETRHVGGMAAITNDGVNFAATVAGAALATMS